MSSHNFLSKAETYIFKIGFLILTILFFAQLIEKEYRELVRPSQATSAAHDDVPEVRSSKTK